MVWSRLGIKDGALEKEISRIDGTKQEYTFGDTTTNKISEASASAIVAGTLNKISSSISSSILSSTNAFIRSSSFATVVGNEDSKIF